MIDMDPLQFDAFHAALSKEFVVIQGPPKTYICLRIVKEMI